MIVVAKPRVGAFHGESTDSYGASAEILGALVLDDDFTEFLTLVAYGRLE